MIFKRDAMKKILPYVDPFCLPIDWQLNYAFKMADLNVYHTTPYLCHQLSGTTFSSTVNERQ